MLLQKLGNCFTVRSLDAVMNWTRMSPICSAKVAGRAAVEKGDAADFGRRQMPIQSTASTDLADLGSVIVEA